MGIEKIQIHVFYKTYMVNCLYFWLTPKTFRTDLSSDKNSFDRRLAFMECMHRPNDLSMLDVPPRVCGCVCMHERVHV